MATDDRMGLMPYDDEEFVPTRNALLDQLVLRAVWMAYDNASDMGMKDESGLTHAAAEWQGYLHGEVEIFVEEWYGAREDGEEVPDLVAEWLPEEAGDEWNSALRRLWSAAATRAAEVEDRLPHPLYLSAGEVEDQLGPYALEQMYGEE